MRNNFLITPKENRLSWEFLPLENLDNVSVQEADTQIKSDTWEIYWELSLFIKEKELRGSQCNAVLTLMIDTRGKDGRLREGE